MLDITLKYFKEIAKIPRCSFHEERILEYLISFSETNNFEYKTDKVGNIIIYIPASPGKENNNTVILQGHMDMVCVKGEKSNHNFDNDSIEILENTGWIKANNTTLGADNGIGLAMMLATTEIIEHPKLELLITSSEEVGLIGAINLEEKYLSGKYLINLDSEKEKEITISSSGGARIDIEGQYEVQTGVLDIYELKIKGMKGGHSGLEINNNKGNAIFGIIEFLDTLKDNIEVYSISGGVADNAIPSSASAQIGIKHIEEFTKKIEEFILKIKDNYDAPNIYFEIKKINISNSIENKNIIENKFKNKLFKQILNNKIGMINMSKNIENLVQTSINLGQINISNGNIQITYLPRSPKTDELEKIISTLNKSYSVLELKSKISSKYPGWEENPKGYLVKTIKSIYDKANNYDNKLTAIHAGLECGAIVEKIGGDVQAISIGPNIRGAHTPKETCELRSIGVICEVLKNILKEIK